MRGTAIALGLAMMVALSGAYAYGQGAGGDPAGKETSRHECWGHGKGFSFTPEQNAKIQDLHRNFQKENAQLIGALVGKRLELQALWADPKADDKTIADKEKEVGVLRNQLRDKLIQMRLDVRKILTPEQIAS